MRSRHRDTTPIKTPNPSGQIETQKIYWSKDELSVFKSLGVFEEKRESTYLAAFLSY